MQFIGRDFELNELDKLYNTEHFQMPVLYGRRRVGKSTLIREFVKNKKCIFYTAIETAGGRNLELFSQAIYQILLPNMPRMSAFNSYEAAFEFIFSAAKEERIVLVIDEYPYLAKSEKSISSILQKFIDEKFAVSKLFLILCGSSMSFMEHQVLGYESPLYGRRTAQFLVKPFDYYTSAKFVKSYSNEDKAVVFGVTGGIPKYLELFDEQKTLRDNLIDLFFKESGYLFEEPSNILKQELRDAARYNAVIEAVASGATKVSEIAGKVKMDIPATTHCLDSLIELGIVSKEHAITEENNKKKTYYTITDGMFRFWHRYVPAGMDAILSKKGDYLFDELVLPTLPDYMAKIFEQMCRQYLLLKDETKIGILSIGRWWGTNPAKKCEEEIDIIAVNMLKKQAIFAECKYRNERLGKDVYDILKERAELFPMFHEKHFYLFSKSGFTSDVTKCGDVTCVDLSQMMDL